MVPLPSLAPSLSLAPDTSKPPKTYVLGMPQCWALLSYLDGLFQLESIIRPLIKVIATTVISFKCFNIFRKDLWKCATLKSDPAKHLRACLLNISLMTSQSWSVYILRIQQNLALNEICDEQFYLNIQP